MGTPGEPKPVKLFTALLFHDNEVLAAAEKDLQNLFGPIDLASESLPWALTDYYEEEMGRGLLRRFVSFEPLVSPETLPEAKLGTQALEGRNRWARDERRGRRVNIDPGYLDAGKVVLVSTKGAPHRLYLRSGIYGETTLSFQNGSFHPLATTYPDYLWPAAMSFFAQLRSRYLSQLKHSGY